MMPNNSQDKLCDWLEENLKKCTEHQMYLRDSAKQFEIIDYKFIRAESVKIFIKSVLNFLAWQIMYRFFRENYFLKRNIILDSFLSRLKFICDINERKH
ncbi:MAG: hypothetical protein NZT61_05500 [Deltaproteobacteria bacterium]|nr:hypothetical protein [Deltaproteobacteria bacterium]MCX7952794.1 hypothetical protein [Deltaproteobacteria bacterium]